MQKENRQHNPPTEQSAHTESGNGNALAADDSTVLQSNLFTGSDTVIVAPPDPTETPFPPLVRTHPLTEQSSLAACVLPYQQELMLRGKSNYTVTCFLSDLKMLSSFLGQDTPIGRITKGESGGLAHEAQIWDERTDAGT